MWSEFALSGTALSRGVPDKYCTGCHLLQSHAVTAEIELSDTGDAVSPDDTQNPAPTPSTVLVRGGSTRDRRHRAGGRASSGHCPVPQELLVAVLLHRPRSRKQQPGPLTGPGCCPFPRPGASSNKPAPTAAA